MRNKFYWELNYGINVLSGVSFIKQFYTNNTASKRISKSFKKASDFLALYLEILNEEITYKWLIDYYWLRILSYLNKNCIYMLINNVSARIHHYIQYKECKNQLFVFTIKSNGYSSILNFYLYSIKNIVKHSSQYSNLYICFTFVILPTYYSA